MPIDFRKRLRPETQARLASHDRQTAALADLTNAELAAYAQMCLQNCEPPRAAKGSPVYDATLWYIVLPLLIDRVRTAPTPSPAAPPAGPPAPEPKG